VVVAPAKARVTEVGDRDQQADERGYHVERDPLALAQAAGEPASPGPSGRVNRCHALDRSHVEVFAHRSLG
jgi:hypothetical protein